MKHHDILPRKSVFLLKSWIPVVAWPWILGVASAQTPEIPAPPPPPTEDGASKPVQPVPSSPQPTTRESAPFVPPPAVAPAARPGPLGEASTVPSSASVAREPAPSTSGAAVADPPSLNGESGLLRVASANGAGVRSMRLSLGLHFFGSSAIFDDADATSRVGGVLGVSGAFIENLELWLNIKAQSTNSVLSRPELLQSLGDMSLGAKGYYAFSDSIFSVGGDVEFTFLTGLGTQSFNFGATQVQLRGIASADLKKAASPIPVQIHFNTGVLVDGSRNFDDVVAMTESERFSAGASDYHRWLFGLGVAVPVKYVTPYLEYTLEIPMGYEATPGVSLMSARRTALRPGQAAQQPTSIASTPALPAVGRVMPQRLTPGIRVTAVPDLTIDAAIEIGLSPGHAPGVVPVPPYTVMFLFSYAIDPFRARGVDGPPIAVPVIIPDPVPPAPTSGHVSGVVVSSVDGKAIEEAVVVFDRAEPVATSGNGRFISHDVAPGALKISAKKAGFEPQNATVDVAVGETRELRLVLVPAVTTARLKAKVVDSSGQGLAGVRLDVIGKETKASESNVDGLCEVDVEEGSVTVVAHATGKYRAGMTVAAKKGEKLDVNLVLKARPASTVAELSQKRIRVKKRVGFSSDNRLTKEGLEVLDAVADVLFANPAIRVRIESHTDNSLSDDEATNRTQEQANQVMAALLERGIVSARMSAVGMGSKQPLAPNLTQRARDQNKRIEFVVRESN